MKGAMKRGDVVDDGIGPLAYIRIAKDPSYPTEPVWWDLTRHYGFLFSTKARAMVGWSDAAWII